MNSIPPELLSQAIKVKQKKDCLGSIYTLSKTLLGYREIQLATHFDILECLQNETARKLLVCPRGAFKSSLASVSFPIWLLLRNPDLRILIDSELYQNSKNFLREIKAHLESEKLTHLFGPLRGSHWTEGSIILSSRTKNLKEASITCSGIGAEKTGQHYDVVIMDDCSSPKNTATEEQRKKVIDHYRYTQSILEPHGTIVVVGTRYHAQDIIGYILEHELELSNDGKDFK